MKLLVCGGAGFIGSTFVRLRVQEHGDEVTVLDKLTYAGRRENLQPVEDEIRFVHGAIEDPEAVARAVGDAEAIVNFAAETHVDRSISGPEAFIVTNMQGTQVLLEAARERALRYLQVSTDEVYGSIEEGSFTEESPLAPSSPYSATKTGADLLVASYFHTYGLETVICRGSNNYGPYQYPEKLIPLMVLNALSGDHLPVYGDGRQVRNWLFVEDFGRGIGHALAHGAPGEAYNCGGPDECENLEVVRRIIELTGASPEQIEYVTDRPGHDRRYSLASEKLRALGWSAQVHFEEGLERTVNWYRDNAWWWEPIRTGEYRAYYERHYGRALRCLTSPRWRRWRRRSSRAGAAPAWWPGARRWRGSSGRRSPIRSTGAGRFPGSATRRLGSSCSDSRRRPTAAIAPAGSSPATAPATGCSPRCGAPGWPTSRSRSHATTGWRCRMRGCAPRSAAPRRSTARPRPSATTACRGWSPSSRCSSARG